MNITHIKKGTILKSGLQVVIYLLLGLALAFLISRPVHATQADYPPPNGDCPHYSNGQCDYPYSNEGTENSDNDNNGYDYPDPPPMHEPTGWLLATSLADNTGQRLAGTVFEIRRALGDELVDTVITDLFGEVSVELPVGDYFLRAVIVPYGFLSDGARHNFTIYENELSPVIVRLLPIPPNEPEPTPTPSPTPAPTPPPQEHGRLIVTSRAHGTGAFIQGVVFNVHRAMDDGLVAQLATNQFGEASVFLPAGDYFLRAIAIPPGFILDTNRIPARIQADRLTEISITHRPTPPEEEPPPPEPEPPEAADGRLLIINRAQVPGTGGRGQAAGDFLSGAIFEVRSTMDDRLMGQLQTNIFGEATINLPAGDYFIRQLAPAASFIADSSRVNIRIVSGELFTVTVLNAPYKTEAEDEEPDTPAYGRLLVTLMSSATGERLQNGTITIHDIMTDALIVTLSSDFFGEASVFLPTGRYFMRQGAMPHGYLTNLDRIPFTINAGDVTDMAIAVRAEPVLTPSPTPIPTPTPPVSQAAPFSPQSSATIETIPDTDINAQSRIEITTRAAGSGNPLSGGLFAVYRVYDNRRIGELTTGADGRGYFMAEPGMHFVRELRPSFGFLLESERIFLEVGVGETVTLELTKIRDMNIAYLPADVEGGGIIYIPQTGQRWPTFNYVGGGILFLISFVVAGFLVVGLIHIRSRD